MSREFFPRTTSKKVQFAPKRERVTKGHFSADDVESVSSEDPRNRAKRANVESVEAQELPQSPQGADTPIDRQKHERFGGPLGYNVSLAVQKAKECEAVYNSLGEQLSNPQLSGVERVILIANDSVLIPAITNLKGLLTTIRSQANKPLLQNIFDANFDQENLKAILDNIDKINEMLNRCLHTLNDFIVSMVPVYKKSKTIRASIGNDAKGLELMQSYLAKVPVFAKMAESLAPLVTEQSPPAKRVLFKGM